MADVLDFIDYKKRLDTANVYIGDLVEWIDFDGSTRQHKVKKIVHNPLPGHQHAEVLPCMPLWEKEDYTLDFEDGLSVIGQVVVRKIVTKRAPRRLTSDNIGNSIYGY